MQLPSLVIPMLKPDNFGWYHMMWLFISALSVILILIFTRRKNVEKQTRVFLIVFAVLMYIGELHKQIVYSMHGEYGNNFVPHFPWETVPLHFCGTPLYVVPIALLAKNKKFKDAALTYLATFAFIGGIGAMLFPGDAYRDRLGNNVQTMVHHYLMIIFAVFMWRSGQVKSFKSFLRASYMFLVFLTTAVLLNTIFNHRSNGVINVFYLNPYQNDPGIIPVISKLIANQSTYVWGLLLYIVAFLGAASFLFVIGKYLNRVLQFFKNKSKWLFDKKIGLIILTSLFLFGSVVFVRLLYNNYFFPTVDFAKVGYGVKLNSFFADLFFFNIVLIMIFSLFKTTLNRTISIVVVSFFTSFLALAQMVISYHYNLLISFETLTVAKNPADEMGLVMTGNFLQLLFERSWHIAFLPFGVILLYAIIYLRRNKVLLVNQLGVKKFPPVNKTVVNCPFLQQVRTKIFVSFGVTFVICLFSISLGVGRNYVNYTWKVSAARQTLELQASGYTAGFLSGAIIQNSHQDNEPVDYQLLSKYNRNKNRVGRVDGYGNPITNELSGIQNDNIHNFDDLKGLFKDKNIFLIQMETFPAFLLGEEKGHIFENYKEQLYPNINNLLKESYFLENFYDSTGVGHTMDAIFSVHMGLPMPGADTLCWRHDNKPIQNNNTLNHLLKSNNYNSLAYEPSTLEFYNTGKCINEVLRYDNLLYADPKVNDPNQSLRSNFLTDSTTNKYIGNDFKTNLFNQYLYSELLKDDTEFKNTFTKLPRKYLLSDDKSEEKITDFDNLREKYIKQQWGIDDRLGFKILSYMVKDNLSIPGNNNKKLLTHYSTALPHIPFAKMRDEDKAFGNERISKIYRKNGRQYLIKDNPIPRPMDANGKPLPSPFHDNLNKMYRSDYNCMQTIGYHDRAIKYFLDYLLPVAKNSVFIFYGDHTATSFRKKSMELAYNRKMTRAEYRSKLKRTAAWVYIPDHSSTPVNNVYSGLLKGVQKHVRSEQDIKDTILELSDYDNQHFSLCHNLFTVAQEVYVDPKTMSVFTDDFYAQALNLSNKNIKYITNNFDYETIKKIVAEQVKFKYELEKVLLSGDFNELNNLR